MLVLLDVTAIALAAPTLLLDLCALVSARSGRSLVARLYRRCDRLLGHHLSSISYLALGYLMIRVTVIALSSAWPVPAKLAAVAASVGISIALVQPLTSIYNTVAALVWRNPPIHLDKEQYFPAGALFEEASTFAAIRRETEAIVSGARPFQEMYPNVTVVESSHGASEGWRSFHLRVADRDIAENHARMPVTSALLRKLPHVCNAFVSIVDGGHRLAPHRGYFKGILRYHLGILVPEPEQAVLHCGGERYHWREGEGVLFDDMYVHSVENRSHLPRAILFLDVRRPVGVLGRIAREPLAWLIGNHPYHAAARERARR